MLGAAQTRALCATNQAPPGPAQHTGRCWRRLQASRNSVALSRLPPRRRRGAAVGVAAAAQPPAADAQPASAERPGDCYFARGDLRPVILFDGVCNLCNGGVNAMLFLDQKGVYRFAALQAEAGRALLQRSGRAPDDISSIVLVEPDGRSYTKSDAVLRIASRLGAPLPLVAAALGAFPQPVKDGFYDFVADNRYSFFGRTPSCRLSDPRFEERFIAS